MQLAGMYFCAANTACLRATVVKFPAALCLVCSKLAAQCQSMEVRNSNFSAFIETFTANTYCMVILSDTSIRE